MDYNAVASKLVERAQNVSPIYGQSLVCFDHVPDAIPDMAFIVGEMDVEYDMTFRGNHDRLLVTCRIFISRSDDQQGQRVLREFMSSGGLSSVKTALEASPRYEPGVWDDLRVQRARGNRLFVIGETRYYGVELEILVVGSG